MAGQETQGGRSWGLRGFGLNLLPLAVRARWLQILIKFRNMSPMVSTPVDSLSGRGRSSGLNCSFCSG